MQQDRFTIKSQEALQEAQRVAHGFSHQEVDGEHLLLALIDQADSLIPDLLEKIGVPAAKLKPDLENELARRHKVQGISSTDLFLSPHLKKVLDAAQTEAGKLKDEYISTEHLLLGLLAEGGPALKKLFQAHGLKRDAVLKALATCAGTSGSPTPTRKTNSRLWRSMGATSRRSRGRAGLTR